MFEIINKNDFKIVDFRSLENCMNMCSSRLLIPCCSLVTNVFPIGKQQLKAGGLQNIPSKTPFLSAFLLLGGRLFSFMAMYGTKFL